MYFPKATFAQILVLAFCAVIPATAASSVTFTIPGVYSMQVTGVNSSGDVVGGYTLVSNGPEYPFLRTSDGTITTITVPGAVSALATSINDDGVVAGIAFSGLTPSCEDSSPCTAFLLSSDGVVSTFNPPGGPASWALLSNGGLVAGTCTGCVEFYVRNPDGSFSMFPGPDHQIVSSVVGIASNGDVLATRLPLTPFVRETDGTYLTHIGTVPLVDFAIGLNASDTVIGYESYTVGTMPVFVFFAQAADGSKTYYKADLSAINDSGVIVGTTEGQGAIFTPSGSETLFTIDSQGTFPSAISSSGIVAGVAAANIFYATTGFLYFP
jgi:hypothetical protein